MYILQKLNRFIIPRTELTYPCHQLKMHQYAMSVRGNNGGSAQGTLFENA